jgi:hypothetical protein
MGISKSADASDGKLLVHKPWGVGYQRLNANKSLKFTLK